MRASSFSWAITFEHLGRQGSSRHGNMAETVRRQLTAGADGIMNPLPTSEDIDGVVDILARSRSLLFITGAGISADSGLPTYRGIGGLYNAEHPEEGIPIEEILSGEMIRRRPELTWKYLGQIEQAARGARFNRPTRSSPRWNPASSGSGHSPRISTGCTARRARRTSWRSTAACTICSARDASGGKRWPITRR